MSVYPKSCHELAIEHLILASSAANQGNGPDAELGLNNAKIYADMHAKRLKLQGRHEDAEKYLSGLTEHSNRVQKVIAMRMNKADGKPDLEKGFAPTGSISSPARREFHETGQIKPTRELKKPGQDPRYDYKPLHELHPSDQVSAHHNYQHKDMHRYSYPVDKQTGRLEHGTRAPLKEGQEPNPSQTAYGKKEFQPEHRPGTSVKINAPGEAHHGKFGIVQKPSPYFPDKVAVQVGHHESMKVFVHPHQVMPKNPGNRIEKAMVTLYNLRKVFLK